MIDGLLINQWPVAIYTHMTKHRGFTLVELLTVIGIITVLLAIVFPVYFSIRGKGRQAVCLSNMRQIGTAMALYSADSNEMFPYGADPSDKFTPIWAHNPDFAVQLAAMPMLHDLLIPYAQNRLIWRCPADTGFDSLDVNFEGGAPVPLDARPTEYEKYGTSYFYRTELALKHKVSPTTVAYESTSPFTEHGPSDVNVLMDGNGSWHGGYFFDQKRYNVLMEDGRVVNQSIGQFNKTWSLRLERGGVSP